MTILQAGGAPTPRRHEPLLRSLLGAVLRHHRLAQGRTLREVAGRAQVSVAYLSEIERGRKEVSSEVLGAVCRSLDLRLVDLVAAAHDTLAARTAPGQGELVDLTTRLPPVSPQVDQTPSGTALLRAA
ncbi:helix-turn-helix domain-containing protein [Actinotalea sp. K2]|uniref:helix-turn-helix domain-containing protein n=1 Tax=Actinotalea sp. K2 TaxID=2939438 RepID=UPI002016AB17|nr:helix-turn-helix transcriptional regulator [Actinotalea sp. K2]MCL3861572.1 helix-turn-helix domain-containing protein [Actinotalea sp. K2]